MWLDDCPAGPEVAKYRDLVGATITPDFRRIRRGATERLGAPKPARDALTAAQACRLTL
jgi:hypothetical protein